MPAGKRQQSNATTLYTLITFVGLFIVATTLAVIFYVKAEKLRSEAAASRSRLEEMATSEELRKIGTLIGAKQGRKSRLGTMVDYLDEMVYLIIGGLPEETSAEVKVEAVNRKTKDVLEPLAQEYPDIKDLDPNTAGLIQIIEKLKTTLDNITDAEIALKERFEQLQNRFDDAMATSFEKEQTLLAEKEKYQQQVNEIAQDYNELKALVEQTSERQVQTLAAQLDGERANSKTLKQELLKTQAELKIAEERMKGTQEQLRALVPPQDTEVAAYKPDGKIILIDESAKIVHLNIGSDDRVYRGLTFSVYDKNMPIPKDGKGKAEIEVFNVGKNISAARVIPSEDFEKALNEVLAENTDVAEIMLSLQKPQQERSRDLEEFAQGSPERLKLLNNLAVAYDEHRSKRPIVLDDIVANLIWDSHKTNVFVIAGDFDLDGDRVIDYEAIDKIKTLVEDWGGSVADTVSIDTDFLVLGSAPQVLKRPTFEEIEADPMAMEKYEASLQRLSSYTDVQSRAQSLSIPVFNAERFLYFIGYRTQASRADAF